MEGIGVLLVVVAAFVANLPALRAQWRRDRPGSIKTIWLLAIYFLYIALGFTVLLLVAPREGGHEGKAPYLIGFIVAWIVYGGLTLMRVVPRYREPPAWLMSFGILGALLACLGAYLRA